MPFKNAWPLGQGVVCERELSMTTNNSMALVKTIAVVIAALCLTASTPAANARSGPFLRLGGDWSGGGRVVLADGQLEHIRCLATDEVGDEGDLMRQHLRCASPS